jgi:hypothetical protein
MDAQVLKRAGKCTWLPERVVFVEGWDVVVWRVLGWLVLGWLARVVAGCAAAGVRVEFVPPLVPFRLYTGLTLSHDTVTGLPHMRGRNVFSLLDRIW